MHHQAGTVMFPLLLDASVVVLSFSCCTTSTVKLYGDQLFEFLCSVNTIPLSYGFPCVVKGLGISNKSNQSYQEGWPDVHIALGLSNKSSWSCQED